VLLTVEAADELDFGTRRSGPTDAERVEVLFAGWKIAPKLIHQFTYSLNDYISLMNDSK